MYVWTSYEKESLCTTVRLEPFIQSRWSHTCGCENKLRICTVYSWESRGEGAAVIVAASTLGMAGKSSWDQANRRQKLGLVWRIRKKISQIIKDYFYLPFFLLIILWFWFTWLFSESRIFWQFCIPASQVSSSNLLPSCRAFFLKEDGSK